MRYPHKIKIYKKRSYLIITFLVIILPIVFILILSPLTGVQAHEVFIDLGASALRVFVAYIISAILAVFLALLLSYKKIGNFLLPILDVLQSFPSFALLPLLLVWLHGSNNGAAVAFLVITIIWPILFSTFSGIYSARQDLKEAAFMFGAHGWRELLYFILPLSWPGLITGSIVGLGDGWEAIVGAEIIGITPGIGSFLNAASTQNNIPVLVFGITALLLFVFSINKLIWLPLLKQSHEYSHE